MSMANMNTITQLTDYSNDELFSLYKSTGRLDIKQEIAMRYLYVVKSIALRMKKVFDSYEQVDDIINEGVIVLMGAIDRFEHERNIKFETYISKRIRGMILDIARKKDLVPREQRRIYKDINDTITNFYMENGREPNVEEISAILGIDEAKCCDIMEKSSFMSVLSLDMITDDSEDNKSTVQLVSENSYEQPEERVMEKALHKILANGVETLKEKEQLVVSLYYVEQLNMKDIANILNISEPRVSQIHTSAIKKLKVYITENS